MANIRKDPTKVFSIRVRGDMWAFFDDFEKETRNKNILEIIEKSDEFKAFKARKEQKDNQPSLFSVASIIQV